MIKTNLTVTTNHVLVAVAAGLIGYGVYRSAKKARELVTVKLNPASSENVVNQVVTSVVGEKNLSTVADYYFGAWDLINPFNESDAYARQVYGLDDLLKGGKNDK